MTTPYRVAAVCLLLFATVGVCVLYAEADQWTYPDAAGLASNPDHYDGHQTLLFGRVVSVDHASETHRLIVEAQDVELTVENVPLSITETVEQGASIQIYGQFNAGSRVMVADEIVVDYTNTADRLYVYLSSLLGGLVAAGLFLWYWRPDVRRFRFVPRSEK